ncbi:1-acyl-sn-glycerol-3-phosphate acyltransferase, partial [Patescibacteria group bacterium]|nr:1-acyl-sn-glycerol-3-phosphate acyltransferase [Patescibacteria group bacterium]
MSERGFFSPSNVAVYEKVARAHQRRKLREIGIFSAKDFHSFVLDCLAEHYAQITEKGQDNLEKAKQVLENGGAVFFTPNHLSHADGAVLNIRLKEAGLDPVFVLGKRILDNPVINQLGKGADCVHVWPLTDTPKNEKEAQQKKQMNEEAKNGVVYALENGRPVVLFLENGRSRTRALKDETYQETSLYFYLVRDRDVAIVPVGLVGTDNILPVGHIRPKKSDVEVIYGE